MRVKSERRTIEEQIRIITECRRSGLTDSEWCLQHNINEKTFYSWLSRLKKRGIIDNVATIPRVLKRGHTQQDIVQISVEAPKHAYSDDETSLYPRSPETFSLSPEAQPGYPVMEITIDNVCVRVTNNVNPALLAQTLRLLGVRNAR